MQVPCRCKPRDFWRLIRDGREVTQLPDDVAEFDADFFNLRRARRVRWTPGSDWPSN